jgi:anaerobic magnesium-protoporphyrin IX monomethyl ester cyclase
MRRLQLRRVMLLTPPHRCGMEGRRGTRTRLGLERLAASLRGWGFEAIVCDALFCFAAVQNIAVLVRREQPDVVFVVADTATAPSALAVLREAKRQNPNVVGVVGGVHSVPLASEMIHHTWVDYAVRDEDKRTLGELISSLNAGGRPAEVRGVSYTEGEHVHHTPDRAMVRALDVLAIEWPLDAKHSNGDSHSAVAEPSSSCAETCPLIGV